MTTTERENYAAALKTQGGYNCCQAVAAALADQTPLSEKDVNAACAGFCAGMGTGEATCGALIGAVMIAGLKTDGNGTVYASREILKKFKTLCGGLSCRELKTGNGGAPLCSCENCVKNAVRAYCETFETE